MFLHFLHVVLRRRLALTRKSPAPPPLGVQVKKITAKQSDPDVFAIRVIFGVQFFAIGSYTRSVSLPEEITQKSQPQPLPLFRDDCLSTPHDVAEPDNELFLLRYCNAHM